MPMMVNTLFMSVLAAFLAGPIAASPVPCPDVSVMHASAPVAGSFPRASGPC